MTENEIEKKWTKEIEKQLVGKKIVAVEYMDKEHCENSFMWYKRPIILIFDDGSNLIPMTDDEGNDGGAMMYIEKNHEYHTFPVLGV